MRRCFSCFRMYGENYSFCPFCGKPEYLPPVEPIHLIPGTVLAKRYIIGQAVGSGGFGIVYKAWDSKLETAVAVKEFYISRLVTRAEDLKSVNVSRKSSDEVSYRKERFLAEARNMAKFGKHRSITNVFEYFEENNTAYIVMELLEGLTLNDYLKQESAGGKVSVDFAVMVASEVAKALRSMHSKNIIHRDIAPDNIFLCKGKGIKVKVMDVGAAKLADTTDDVIDIILKPGYSPPEQYEKDEDIGPWTDIYALGATMYRMLTGEKPVESTNRKYDELVPPVELNSQIPERISNIIMRAMAVESHLRFQTVDEFLEVLNSDKKVDPVKKVVSKRKVKRVLGITAAVLAVAVISCAVFGIYLNRKKANNLEEAEITVWIVDDGYSDKTINALRTLAKDNFPKQEGNEKVTIKVEAVEKDGYEEKLLKALKSDSDNKPTLFESSGISDGKLEKYAESLSNVAKNSDVKKIEIIKNNYKNAYPDMLRMPLAISIPVAYDLSGKATDVYFDDAEDLEGNITADKAFSSLIEDNYGRFRTADFSKLLEGGEYQKTTFLSSSEMWRQINSANYKLNDFSFSCVYPESSKIYCEFSFEWSICSSSSENQILAAEKFLRYMLTDNYLARLCSDRIPVSESALSKSFDPVKKLYSKFYF